MSRMNSKLACVVYGFGGGMFLMFLLGGNMPISPTSVNFKITDPSGQGSIELQVDGEEINYEAVLEHVFKDDILGPGVAGWLQQKQQMFRLHDEALVTAIESSLCDPIPATPLTDRVEKAKECAEKEVVSGLRTLASNHRTPFHYVGVVAKVGIPAQEEHRPRPGRANVCRDGGLLGKTLEVIEPVTRTMIEVEATGSYSCTGYTKFPDIQLSMEDAGQLFGERPLGETEEIIVVPIG